MRRWIWGACVVLMITFAVRVYEGMSTRVRHKNVINDGCVEQAVSQVFCEEGLKESTSKIESFFYYGTMYLSEQDKRELLQTMAMKLGISSDCDYACVQTATGSETSLVKKGNQSQVELKVITYEIEESENLASLRQYIEGTIQIEDSIESGLYYKRLLENALNEIEKTDEGRTVSVSIEGKLNGRLSLEGQKEIANQILNSMAAEVVMECNPTEQYNVYGYSKQIRECMALGNQKININVTYSYDEEQDITYIYIASPIANYDY